MVKVQEKSKCCGCHACATVCPKHAIAMVSDAEGFLYPQIDSEACVDCGLCEKVCPIFKVPHQEKRKPKAYAVVHKDTELRLDSSSGGVFSAFASHILENGGVVFGAAFDEAFNLHHIFVETKKELRRLRGSKYTQSKIGDSYRQAKSFLDAGGIVLFTGTPCQVEGLLSFLRKPYDNLFTLDIVCHGVPSPMVFKKYLAYRQKQADGAGLTGISFRKKVDGWRRYAVSFQFDNGRSYQTLHTKDPMMRAFLNHLCLRPSCHECAFKALKRQSDITLADFWGVENIFPDLDDDKGVSLVLLHSEKGRALFEAVQSELITRETDAEKAIVYNPSVVRASLPSPQRAAFMKEIEKSDFGDTAKRFLRVSSKQKIRSFLSKVKRKMFRR